MLYVYKKYAKYTDKIYAIGTPARRIPAPGRAFNIMRDFNAVKPFFKPSIAQNPVPNDNRFAYP